MLRLRHLFKQHFELTSILRIDRVSLVDNLSWRDVATGARISVGHALNHSLRQQPLERFIDGDEAAILQCLGEEPRIQKVENRVLYTSHVLLNGKPASDGFRIKGQICVARIREAKEIPRRTHEGVHGVRLPSSGFATGWAADIDPVIKSREGGTAPPLQIDVLGKSHRQLISGHWLGPAVRAVDDRNRTTPVALT